MSGYFGRIDSFSKASWKKVRLRLCLNGLRFREDIASFIWNKTVRKIAKLPDSHRVTLEYFAGSGNHIMDYANNIPLANAEDSKRCSGDFSRSATRLVEILASVHVLIVLSYRL